MKICSFLSVFADKLLVEYRWIKWKHTWLRWLMQSIVIAAACVFALFLLNRILFPCYREAFARDVTIELIATGQKNDQSLHTNIRLSQLKCNGTAMDLSAVELDGNWCYSETDDFLYTYQAEDANRLVLELHNAISVDLTFVSERGSGIVEILVNGKPYEVIDLYSDETWSYEQIRYDTSVLIHPEQHPWLFMLAFLFALGLVYAGERFLSERVRNFLGAQSRVLLLQGILAFLICISGLFIQYQHPQAMAAYLSADYLIHLEAYVLVFLLIFSLYWLTGVHWLSFAILAFVLETLNLVSIIKQSARGTPLLPWDFQIAGAALSVADGYDLSISAMSFLVLAASAAVSVSLFMGFRGQKPHRFPHRMIGLACCIPLLALFLQTTVFRGVWNNTSSTRVYQVRDYYEENGFLVSFGEYINYLLPQEPPEGYSEETMLALVEQIHDAYSHESSPEEQAAPKLPNLIVVMSESFWDITSLERIEFAEDPLPVYRKLTEQTMYGNLLSHVFGGNTVVSEFELLTGFHGSFFPSDYMVYGSCLGNSFRSAAGFLGDQGYYTVAMHPYEATNYNRNTAYLTLGFHETMFEADFPADAGRIRNYISDAALYDQITDHHTQLRDKSSAPLFTFAITMQNHGGYWEDTIYEDAAVDFTASGYQDSTVACMNDYFAGLHESDAALERLITYFEQVPEDTIIVYFGDHMSDAGTKTEKMLESQSWYDADTFSYDPKSHTVPYFVWSNCGIGQGQQDMMDISTLLPSVLQQTEISMPLFWHYLLDVKQVCGAFNSAVAVQGDQNVVSLTSLSPEQQDNIEDLELLTYDYVWGKRYAESLWEIP